MARITLLHKLVSSNFFGQRHTFTANVMAPLHIADDEWDDFAAMLRTVHRMGVDAVSVDVWWGLVATSPDIYDWSYYDRVVAYIEAENLLWVPIMSFHECGPNVGDEYRQPIPEWIWTALLNDAAAQGNTDFVIPDDLKYLSEKGPGCDEVVSLWADRLVLPYYKAFMQAFQQHYSTKAYMTQEINLSCGASGELRYPSYNTHDGGGYPQQGYLQCYSKPARRDLARWAEATYRQVVRLNQRWGTQYASFDDVLPPPSAATLFGSINSTIADDFVKWYNDSLIDHGRRMIAVGISAFEGTTFASIPLGVKMPGIHWRITDAYSPRSAEICAGLIRATDNGSVFNGHGYLRTLERLIERRVRDRVLLHFTCLEMIDDGPNSPSASRAESLVAWVGLAAHKLGINVKGENALAEGVGTDLGWKQIDSAIRNYYYSGITTLRINNVTQGLGKERYWRLIADMKGYSVGGDNAS